MRSLRSKILTRIVIITIVSFSLSSLFIIYYYFTILKSQIIKDDHQLLKQSALQLNYMSDDIQSFTASLIVSESVQDFLKSYPSLSEYDKISSINRMQEELLNYISLRKEILHYTFVFPDGQSAIFVNLLRDTNNNYMNNKLQEAWYQNYKNSGRTFTFTSKHNIIHLQSTKRDVISYIAQIRDLQNTNEIIGELVLFIDFAHFDKQLSFAASGFDGYVWLNDENNVMSAYGKAETDPKLQQSFASASGKNPVSHAGGYLLVENFPNHDWKLVSYTSRDTLIERSQYIIYLLAFFSLVSILLILILIMPVIINVTKPILALNRAMKAVSAGELQTSVSIKSGDEIELLAQGFNRMTERLGNHIEASIFQERENRRMEFELLRSQINPHFIYNTLNTIIYMATKQHNQDIIRITQSFMNLLQDTVRIGDDNPFNPLRDEINILKEYLRIQAYRYQDKFAVEWEVEEAAKNCLVPRSMIQPLVENAIFHGICPKAGQGVIRIGARITQDQLLVTVEDDGVGFSADPHNIPSESVGMGRIGLANMMERLAFLYDRQASLNLESHPGMGTVVTIRLPVTG
jgi:two-component system sensor histidine kinase YesM